MGMNEMVEKFREARPIHYLPGYRTYSLYLVWEDGTRIPILKRHDREEVEKLASELRELGSTDHTYVVE